jgi:hypothetical protein
MALVTTTMVPFRDADLLRLAIIYGHMGTSAMYRGEYPTASSFLYKKASQ